MIKTKCVENALKVKAKGTKLDLISELLVMNKGIFNNITEDCPDMKIKKAMKNLL